MRTLTKRIGIPTFLLLAALLWAPALAAEAGKFLEKSVDVPRSDRVAVDLAFEKAAK